MKPSTPSHMNRRWWRGLVVALLSHHGGEVRLPQMMIDYAEGLEIDELFDVSTNEYVFRLRSATAQTPGEHQKKRWPE